LESFVVSVDGSAKIIQHTAEVTKLRILVEQLEVTWLHGQQGAALLPSSIPRLLFTVQFHASLASAEVVVLELYSLFVAF
jgi:hypothetical protein